MLSYVDPVRHWPRIRPHLKAAEPVLVRDFNKYTYGRWRQKFTAGRTPRQFESCDWDIWHRGRPPAYWQYVKHAACHWLVNHNLELAQAPFPSTAGTSSARRSIQRSSTASICCST